jgi:2-haloacid dehalogenase
MVTLTNSPPTPDSQSPLEHAGLHKYFERQFNIQTARAYKPAPVVYHMVAQELGVEPVIAAWSPATCGTPWAARALAWPVG